MNTYAVSNKYSDQSANRQIKNVTPNYYTQTTQFKTNRMFEDNTSQRDHQLKVTTLKLPSKVIVRSGSSSTIHNGNSEYDKIQSCMKQFKQKIIKEMEDQQHLIVILQQKLKILQKQLEQKQNQVQILRMKLSINPNFKSTEQQYPELDYLKTQCKQINKKIKVIVKEHQNYSLIKIQKKVDKIMNDLLQVAIVKVGKLNKNSSRIDKVIQTIQTSIKDHKIVNTQTNNILNYQKRLQQYHRITHQFLNLLLKFQQYPLKLEQIQNKVVKIEHLFTADKSIISPRLSTSINTMNTIKQSNSSIRIEQLRSTLIKMRGDKALTKIKIDSQGLMKFSDTDTYIFDGDGSFFKLQPQQLNKLTSSRIKFQN